MNEEFIKTLSPGSYIVTCSRTTIANELFNNICDGFSINIHDRLLIDQEESIKISDIRKIKNILSYKPSGQYTLIEIANAHNLTMDAANAMLKILEEPPKNTIIILCVKNLKTLLPTIISRCKKYHLRDNDVVYTEDRNTEYFNKLKESEYLFEKFGIIDEIINKKTDIKKLLLQWIMHLKTHCATKDIKNIKTIHKYLMMYKKGISQKLFLENLIMEIV